MDKQAQRLLAVTALIGVTAVAIIAVIILHGSTDLTSSKPHAVAKVEKEQPATNDAVEPEPIDVGVDEGADEEVQVDPDSPFVTGYDQDGDGILDGVVPAQAEIPESPADGDCGYITKDFPYGDTAKAYVRVDGSVGCTIARLVIYDAISPSSGFDGTVRGWTCIPDGETIYNEICSKPAVGGLATVKSVRTTWL